MPDVRQSVPFRRSLAIAAVVSTLLGGVSAQSSLRAFGGVRFDTDTYSLPMVDVAAGSDVTAVLRSDGRILVHGMTNLPDGPPPPVGTSYVRIAMPTSATFAAGFALLSNGGLVGWDANGASLTVPTLPANTTWTKVVAGSSHAVALRSDGVAVAWGSNSVGQSTVPALPPGVTVVDVHAGGSWTLLLLSNGQLVAFGANSSNQGNVPALPPGLVYTAIWGGSDRAIARRSDGSLVTWGNNASGQGNLPALPAGVTYTTFALGSSHTAALRSDGVIAAWGNNSYGQLAVPTLPVGVPCVQLVAGQLHTLARFANGEVVGWGDRSLALPLAGPGSGNQWLDHAVNWTPHALSSSGQVLALAGASIVPSLPLGFTYTALLEGGNHQVALRSDGRAVAWGDNNQGQCAIPPLPPGMTYLDGSLSFAGTVLLRSDGMAVGCGQFATGLPVPPPGVRFVQASAHDQGLMLLRSDGELYVQGSTSNSTQRPALPAGVQYTAIARARYYNAALRSDGQVDLWGATFQAPLPALPFGVYYLEIDAGYDELVARRSDGTIVAAAPQASEPVLAVPQPGAGESFVQVETNRYGTVRVGPTCTYIAFATGCAGSRPASRLVPTETPRVGKTHGVRVFDLPLDAAILVFGLQRTAPIPLDPYGMPGCTQHVQVDAAVLLTGQHGNAVNWMHVPNDLALLGVQFHNQAIVLDPSANPAGAVVSNAATGVIGRQ